MAKSEDKKVRLVTGPVTNEEFVTGVIGVAGTEEHPDKDGLYELNDKQQLALGATDAIRVEPEGYVLKKPAPAAGAVVVSAAPADNSAVLALIGKQDEIIEDLKEEVKDLTDQVGELEKGYEKLAKIVADLKK